MTTGRSALDYLDDILDAVSKAEEFVLGMDYDAFAGDAKTHFAVVRCLEIIGEAAKNIPSVVRSRYPNIPWREMAGIRDKLSHAYFGVDLRTVWKTIQQDLPELRSQILKISQEITHGTPSTD